MIPERQNSLKREANRHTVECLQRDDIQLNSASNTGECGEDFQPPGKQPSWYHEHSPINVNSESKLPMSTLSLEETETLKGG